MFTLSYWSLSETETDLIAVCWDILYKTPLCRRSKIQYISIPSSWSAFFSRVILASRLLQAALTDSKVERMRKAGIFSLYKHKGPRSLQVNGKGILVTTYCVTTYCHILASFAAFAVSVLKRLSVLYSVAKTVLLPRTWRVIEYHRFWLKGQRTEGFFGSLVLPFLFPMPVNLTQSDSIWFNLIQFDSIWFNYNIIPSLKLDRSAFLQTLEPMPRLCAKVVHGFGASEVKGVAIRDFGVSGSVWCLEILREYTACTEPLGRIVCKFIPMYIIIVITVI